MTFQRINHVGIVFNDLAAAKAFFLDLGFKLDGEGPVEGEWVENVVGIKGMKVEFAMVSLPGGGANLELIQFKTPVDAAGPQPNAPNMLGIRHIAIEVDDIDALVAKAQRKGAGLLGVVQQFENEWKLCYLRGPEGIILEVAQKLS